MLRIVLTVSALAIATSAAAFNGWTLAAHGATARSESQFYSTITRSWKTSLTSPHDKGATCSLPSWSTPFDGFTVSGGVALRSDGTIFVPLACSNSSFYYARLAQINANTGSYEGDVVLGRAGFESKVTLMPNGNTVVSLANGMLLVLNNLTVVQSMSTTRQLVLAVTNSHPVQQLIASGGTGGGNWWGYTYDIVSGVLQNPQENDDSTIMLGGDGTWAMNNHWIGGGGPYGLQVWSLPLSSSSTPGTVISSCGDTRPWQTVATTNDQIITCGCGTYSWNRKTGAQLWASTIPDCSNAALSDDESTVLIYGYGTVYIVDAATGTTMHTWNATSNGVSSCDGWPTPYGPRYPVPLSDNTHMAIHCNSPKRGIYRVPITQTDARPTGQVLIDSTRAGMTFIDATDNVYFTDGSTIQRAAFEDFTL